MSQIVPYDLVLGWAEQYGSLSPDRFLLGKSTVPPEWRRAVALQLQCRGMLEHKLPSWSRAGVYLPRAVSLEQCSSEKVAIYKTRFVDPHDSLLDLTAGLGVDFWAMASVSREARAVEQDGDLCSALTYNLSRLSLSAPYRVHHGDSMTYLQTLSAEELPTLIYVDPARREDVVAGRRVYAIEDCVPNLYTLLPLLRECYQRVGKLAPRVLVKLSPMLDIRHTLTHIPGAQALHLVSYHKEIKELLLHFDLGIEGDNASELDVPITLSDISPQGELWSRTFVAGLRSEQTCALRVASKLGRYLYEPMRVWLKAGFYALLTELYGVEQVHPSSHIYTSEELREDFPGRSWELIELIPFRSSLLKSLVRRIGRAEITCRNFPLGAEELRRRLRLSDGGDTTLLATTLYDGEHYLLHCRRV